jgi:hypothetical protein
MNRRQSVCRDLGKGKGTGLGVGALMLNLGSNEPNSIMKRMSYSFDPKQRSSVSKSAVKGLD